MKNKINSKQLVAGWSYTKRCNLKCVHCYSSSGKAGQDELTLKESYKVVDKLKKSGVVAINFGGGECCLRKDFIKLCKYINKKGIKISYTSNGTTFKLIEKHLDLFHDIGISIDFANREKHDWFRGMPGTYDKAIKAIKTLVKKGVNNEIVTCLTKLNCSEKELRKLYNLTKELNVDHWRLNRFRANGRGIDNRNYLALTKQDLRKAYKFLAKHADNSVSTPEPLFRAAFGGYYSLEGDPSGFTAFRIQSNGEVSPSVFLTESGGNIKEKSIDQIMNSKIFQQIRNRKPNGKCKNCTSYHHCKGGDAGASFLVYRHFHGPDPLCWLNKRSKKPSVKKLVSKKWNVHERYLCTLYIPIKK